jgi:hypothetical protein
MEPYKRDHFNQRVRRRMLRFKLFAIHLLLSIGAVMLMVFGGAAGWATAEMAVVVTGLAMGSMVIHGIWLSLTEIRNQIVRQEYERLHTLETDNVLYDDWEEKPKRHDDRLLEADNDGEPLDLDAWGNERPIDPLSQQDRRD